MKKNKLILGLVLIFLTLVSIIGLSVKKSNNLRENVKTEKFVKKGEYKKITSNEAKKLMETEKWYIIADVRSTEEYANGHIPNAISIPLDTIGNEAKSQLKDKNQLIMVYCRTGRRSREATLKLIEEGYANVIDFGGINDWTGEIVK